MTFSSLTNPTHAINLYAEKNHLHHDILIEHLTRSRAMVRMALSDDFMNQEPETIYNYLSLLEEIVSKALDTYDRMVALHPL